MENFKITQKRLIDLVQNSTYYLNVTDSKGWHEVIENACESYLSVAFVKKHLANIEDVSEFYGKDEFSEFDNETKTEILVRETLYNCFLAKAYKIPFSENIPSSTSINIEMKEILSSQDIKNAKLAKIRHDNRPSFTKEMTLEFINSNREMIAEILAELDQLKSEEKKDVWQVRANALIQKVSNNDFRVLNWKEIYQLIKSQF